jgi:lysozyme family protein
MADFNFEYPLLLGYEGNTDETVKGDSGGETCCGIDRNSNPNWIGWTRVDGMKALPGFPGTITGDAQIQEMVKSFYDSLWERLNLVQVNHQGIADCIYNGCINQGHRTVAWLQFCMNAMNRTGHPDIVEDGAFGTGTLDDIDDVIAAGKGDLLFTLLKSDRIQHYTQSAHDILTDRQFLAGWINRITAGG